MHSPINNTLERSKNCLKQFIKDDNLAGFIAFCNEEKLTLEQMKEWTFEECEYGSLLHFAVQNYAVNIVDHLIVKMGFSPNSLDKYGFNPLHLVLHKYLNLPFIINLSFIKDKHTKIACILLRTGNLDDLKLEFNFVMEPFSSVRSKYIKIATALLENKELDRLALNHFKKSIKDILISDLKSACKAKIAIDIIVLFIKNNIISEFEPLVDAILPCIKMDSSDVLANTCATNSTGIIGFIKLILEKIDKSLSDKLLSGIMHNILRCSRSFKYISSKFEGILEHYLVWDKYIKLITFILGNKHDLHKEKDFLHQAFLHLKNQYHNVCTYVNEHRANFVNMLNDEQERIKGKQETIKYLFNQIELMDIIIEQINELQGKIDSREKQSLEIIVSVKKPLLDFINQRIGAQYKEVRALE